MATDELRPGRPSRAGRRRDSRSEVDATGDGAVMDMTSSPVVPSSLESEHPTALVADSSGGGEVLAWLRTAFDGVRAELRVVRDSVDRQQAALANITESHGAADRLVDIADGLPARIGDAVREAVRSEGGSRTYAASSAPPASLEGVGAVNEVLRSSLAEVHASAAELRNEMVRLAAFRQALADDLPTVASAVDAASRRAGGRLSDLTDRVNDLAGRPEWEEALRSLRIGKGEASTGGE